MTLLKDLVWHSALRCRDAGEVEVGGGGGGGSFIHLVENTEQSWILADWSIAVGDVDNGPYIDHGSSKIQVQREDGQAGDSWLQVGLFNESSYLFLANVDGSLHWGDGTGQPDTTLERLGPDVLGGFARLDLGGRLMVGDTQTSYTEIGAAVDNGIQVFLSATGIGDDAILSAWDYEVADSEHFAIHGDGSLHWGDGTDPPIAKLAREASGPSLYVEGWGFGIYHSDDVDHNHFLTMVPPSDTAGGYLWFLNPTGHEGDIQWYSAIDGDADYRFQFDASGKMLWGDGTNPPDVSLFKGAAPGSLVIGDEAAANAYFIPGEMGVTAANNTDYIDLDANTGAISIYKHGGRLYLESPNGTAYNITVANDGAVTSTPA